MRELIAFRLGEQEFCVDIMAVREIRGWTPATRLPHSPSFVLGVIILSGAVLPIFDLADYLGMKPAQPTSRHAIVVAGVRQKTIGLLVDAVSDILSVANEIIKPTPEVSGQPGGGFARGIVAVEGRMICLIELERLFRTTESEAA
jgi:purine-binding chemotaxis protein CheW